MKKEANIVIRGGYGLGNFGDDALMHTIASEMLRVSDKVVLLCRPSSYISDILPGVEVIDYRNIKNPITTKLLIYGGGTQFYHFKKNVTAEAFMNKILNFSLLKLYIKRKLLNRYVIENKFQISNYARHIALVGVGVGPFDVKNSSIERKTAELFKKANFVGVRDNFAMKKAKEWGVQSPIISPDICYSFRSDFLDSYVNESDQVKSVGFIVRDWNYANGGALYYEKLQTASEELRKRGFHVKYIIFDSNSDSYWKSKLDKEHTIVWDPKKDTFDSFLRRISPFDLFVTARFHGAIFASLLKTPFIAIEVEQKLKFVAETFKESSSCWDQPFELEDLYLQIDEISMSYTHRKKMVEIQGKEFKKLSDDMFVSLKSFIDSYN